MTQRTCSIDGCNRPHKSRGWCKLHYQRWTRTGDPEASRAPQFATWDEAFIAYAPEVLDGNGCRLWQGSAGKNGYGLVWARNEPIGAHRYAWERANGPIPAGMVVDHICHQRRCVEVTHLRLATISQNNANRSGPASHNATGVRGVRKMRNKFSGRARKNGVEYNAGTYATIEEAAEAVQKLRAELFGEFAGRG